MRKQSALDLLSAARIRSGLLANKKDGAPRVSVANKVTAQKPNLRKSVNLDPVEMVGRSAESEYKKTKKAFVGQDEAKNKPAYQLGAARIKEKRDFGYVMPSTYSSTMNNQIGARNRDLKLKKQLKNMRDEGKSIHDRYDFIDRHEERADSFEKRQNAVNKSKSAWARTHGTAADKRKAEIENQEKQKRERENAAKLSQEAAEKAREEKAVNDKKREQGLGPGESSTIRGLKVKRLNSKELQDRAESSPDVMKHVNKVNNKASGEGTGNEDERASGSAQDARDVAYHKRKSDETPGNTSHYTKEPFKIPDMPSSPKKEGLSRGQKIGLGVGAVGAVAGAVALRRYLKNRKAKKEAEMNKSASLFSGETRHDVNVGKETRDWIDAKGAKAGQALSKAKDYASSMKEKAAPYATKRNAQIGGAGLLGAYAVYKGGKAVKGAIKNRLDERSARRKEDDRIKYYKGQMDTHKDNPHMLRALTSRMSKEKFDA